jgi:DNA repair exonuclease SbcCD ATPase subunit
MRFLNFLRKAREEAAVQAGERKDIPLQDLLDFYREKLASRILYAERKGMEYRKSISRLFGSLPTGPLESAVFEEGDKRYAAVNMAKDSYVTKMKSLAASLPAGGSSRDFHEQAEAILSEIKNTTPKQAMALSNFFKKESEAVIQKLKEIETAVSGLGLFLSSDGKVVDFMSSLERDAGEIVSLLENENALRKRLKHLAEEAEKLAEERERANSELKELLGGEEWQEAEREGRFVERLEREINELRYNIGGELSSLKRPLKKAKHIMESPLLGRFISNPFVAFISGEGLGKVLGMLAGLMEDGRISLKEKERQKVLSMQGRLEELERMKEAYKMLEAELEVKRRGKEMSAISKRKGRLEEKIRAFEAQINSRRKEMETVKKRLSGLEEEAAMKRKKLEEFIKKSTGDDITLILGGERK